jgi:hypothetical protein
VRYWRVGIIDHLSNSKQYKKMVETNNVFAMMLPSRLEFPHLISSSKNCELYVLQAMTSNYVKYLLCETDYIQFYFLLR